MSLLDDIKNLADDHGKIPLEKLNELKDSLPSDQFDKLKEIADSNNDGSLDLADLKDFNVDTLIDNAKSTFGNLFGK